MLECIPTADMTADIMTKALDRVKHIKFSISLSFSPPTGLRGGVEGVIPVEGNRANVATTAELYAAPAAEHSTECCTNKNKNAPEEWCIHAKRIKS